MIFISINDAESPAVRNAQMHEPLQEDGPSPKGEAERGRMVHATTDVNVQIVSLSRPSTQVPELFVELVDVTLSSGLRQLVLECVYPDP